MDVLRNEDDSQMRMMAKQLQKMRGDEKAVLRKQGSKKESGSR